MPLNLSVLTHRTVLGCLQSVADMTRVHLSVQLCHQAAADCVVKIIAEHIPEVSSHYLSLFVICIFDVTPVLWSRSQDDALYHVSITTLLLEHAVDFIFFSDEKVFTVASPVNLQNDRVYTRRAMRRSETSLLNACCVVGQRDWKDTISGVHVFPGTAETSQITIW